MAVQSAFRIWNNEEAPYSADSQSIWFRQDIEAIVLGIKDTGVISGGVVTAQGSPDRTVHVTAGTGRSGGTLVTWIATDVTLTNADGTLDRQDMVVVDSGGTVTKRTGTAAAETDPADFTAGDIYLGNVFLPHGTSTVITSYITDKRIFLPLPNVAQIQGGAALTKTDDTNVTVTLGGTPASALLAAVSLTLGWTGTLAQSRGGTGSATPFANPSASVGLAAVNGSATTFMRSDAAPALSVAITPTWTGVHIWNQANIKTTYTDGLQVENATASDAVNTIQQSASLRFTAHVWNTTATAADNSFDVRQTLVPASGTTPSARFSWRWSNNGGSFAEKMALTDLGVLDLATGFRIAGAATAANVLRGDGTNFISAALGTTDLSGAAALTKTDDTNVTLTLGGTPATSLLRAASLTLGWTGTLAVARGGIGVGTLAVNGVLYGNTTSAVQALAVNSSATNKFLTQSSSNAPAWATIVAGDLPANGANPSASVGLAAVNGSATTFMRSDAAPALSVAITPTWTGLHTFQNAFGLTVQPVTGTGVLTVSSGSGILDFADIVLESNGTGKWVLRKTLFQTFNIYDPVNAVNATIWTASATSPGLYHYGHVQLAAIGAAAPTNTTAGDFTGKRIMLGTDAAFSANSEQFAINSAATSVVLTNALAGSSAPQIIFRASRGSIASPTASQSGDSLLVLQAYGYGTTGWAGGSVFQALTTQVWTDANNGMKVVVNTIADNTNTTRNVAQFNADGGMGILTWARVGSLTAATHTGVGDFQAVAGYFTTAITIGGTAAPVKQLNLTGTAQPGTGYFASSGTTNILNGVILWDGGTSVTRGGWVFQKWTDAGAFSANLVTISQQSARIGVGILNPDAPIALAKENSLYFSFDTDDATLPVGLIAHRLAIKIAGSTFDLPVVA